MQIAIKIVVGLIALLLLVMGVNAMLAPLDAAANFGLVPEGIVGLSTMRGDIGGMFVTGGVLLALGILRGETLWFLAAALLMGLIALGRLIGFVVDGVEQSVLVPLIFELVFVAIFVVAHRQLNAEPT